MESCDVSCFFLKAFSIIKNNVPIHLIDFANLTSEWPSPSYVVMYVALKKCGHPCAIGICGSYYSISCDEEKLMNLLCSAVY